MAWISESNKMPNDNVFLLSTSDRRKWSAEDYADDFLKGMLHI